MTQILHIFRKDLRHHWPYVLLAIVVSILLHLLLPVSLSLKDPRNHNEFSDLLGLLQPVAWLLVVARLVQDEAIPGTTQFWISRPYDWRCLLAAKGLFLILVVHTPLLLLHMGALARNGFSPWPHLGSLLMQQLGLFAAASLLSWAGAALTTNLAHFLLWFLVLGVAVAMGIQYQPLSLPQGLDWMPDFLRAACCSAFSALLLLWQYWRRGSRIALGIGAVGCLVLIFLPRAVSTAHAINWQKFLSPASVAPALTIQLDVLQPPLNPEDFPANANSVYASIPLAMKGFEERDFLVHVEAVWLVTTQGERIPVGYWNIYKVPSGQGAHQWRQVIFVKRRDLPRLKSAVRIEGRAILSTFRRVASAELPLSPEPSWIEGIGWCVAGEWRGSEGVRVRCRQTADNRNRVTVEPIDESGNSKSDRQSVLPQSGRLGPTLQLAPVSVATSWAANYRGIQSFRLQSLTYEYTGLFAWALDAVPLADFMVEGTGPPIKEAAK